MPRGGAKGKRKISGSVNSPSVEARKARSRQDRTYRADFDGHHDLRIKETTWNTVTTIGLGTAESKVTIFGSYLAPDGTGTGASAGRHSAAA